MKPGDTGIVHSRRRIDSAPTQVELEKSAGSVRQRLKEETEKDGEDAGLISSSLGTGSGGRRTPRMPRSRKSSERHLSTATLTASSEDKKDEDDDEEEEGGTLVGDAVMKELVKKMKNMAEVIQARETNVFDLSKMNAELTETVTSLR